MTFKTFIALSSLIFFTSNVFGQLTVPFPIHQIVDAKVDRDKTLSLVANVIYPNGCYQENHIFGKIDEGSRAIHLYHTANLLDGLCVQALTSKILLLEMEKPQPGVYQVFDTTDSRYLGDLRIEDKDIGSSIKFGYSDFY